MTPAPPRRPRPGGIADAARRARDARWAAEAEQRPASAPTPPADEAAAPADAAPPSD